MSSTGESRGILFVGSDHAGYRLKLELAAHAAKLGFEVRDLGTDSETSCDYPDYAHAVIDQVTTAQSQKGKGDLSKLLRGAETWTVTPQPKAACKMRWM